MIKNNDCATNKYAEKIKVRGSYYTKVLNTHLLSYYLHQYIKYRVAVSKLSTNKSVKKKEPLLNL